MHPPAPELRVLAHDPDWQAEQVAARRVAEDAEPRRRGKHEADDAPRESLS